MKHHAPASSSARPLDALLAEYASGSLPLPLHALIAAHLDLNPESEGFVTDLERLAGREIDDQAPVELGARQAMLDAIFAETGATVTPKNLPSDTVLTPALSAFLGGSLSDLKWKMVLPGVKEHVVWDNDGVEAKLYWIKPGRKLPTHTHEGQEVTLVLKGGFSDSSGRYRRGDVAVADEDIDHRPVADMDEDCICFAVTDAPLRLTGPIGRVFQSLMGR